MSCTEASEAEMAEGPLGQDASPSLHAGLSREAGGGRGSQQVGRRGEREPGQGKQGRRARRAGESACSGILPEPAPSRVFPWELSHTEQTPSPWPRGRMWDQGEWVPRGRLPARPPVQPSLCAGSSPSRGNCRIFQNVVGLGALSSWSHCDVSFPPPSSERKCLWEERDLRQEERCSSPCRGCSSHPRPPTPPPAPPAPLSLKILGKYPVCRVTTANIVLLSEPSFLFQDILRKVAGGTLTPEESPPLPTPQAP